MQLGSSQRTLWRQRVVGSLVFVPVHFVLYLTGLVPLEGAQLLVLVGLPFVYLAALLSKDGHSLVAWAVYLYECLVLALFIRTTGGAASPWQVIAYPWMFGSALVLLLDGMRPAVVSWLALLTALTLAFGGWGTEGFVLFAAINALSVASMFAALLSFNLERRAARTDALLPMILNRGAGLERLEEWVTDGEAFYLSFIDLGGFKGVNDTHGHRVGDEVLGAVARRLRDSVRRSDIVLRYGGDEFIVATKLDLPVERLEALFTEPVQTTAGLVRVWADVGCVRYEQGDLETVLRRADALMYRRKRSSGKSTREVAPA